MPAEARRIWVDSLSELQLQMTRATFDTWLRGSHVIETGDGCLTIAVRHSYAVDWLQHRLLPVIQRTVAVIDLPIFSQRKTNRSEALFLRFGLRRETVSRGRWRSFEMLIGK